MRDRHGPDVVRVNAAWIEARVIVEFDGATYHRTPQLRARNEQRRQHLVGLGEQVVVLHREDLQGRRFATVIDELRRLRGAR